MTHIGTLWGDLNQRQTKVILSVAAVNELELDVPQPWSFLNKPAAFTAKFTHGKIPAFEGTDGFKLIEGAAIARYISSVGTKVNLLGSNPQEVALVDQWVHFAEHEIGTVLNNVMYLVYGIMPFDRETFNKNTQRLSRSLGYLETHLATRATSYAVSDSVTLADIVLASVIWHAGTVSLGSAEREQYPNTFTYYAKVTEDERLEQYLGTEGFVGVQINEPKPAPWS